MFVDQLDLHWRAIALLAALAPGGILFWLLWRPAGAHHLRYAMATAAALGTVVAFPVIVVELLVEAALPPAGGALGDGAATAFLVAALPEEGAKFALLLGFALRHEDRETPADAIRMAVAIALGFALLENLFYVWDTPDWAWVALMRAVTAVPSHAFDGLLMGACAAAALMRPHRRAIWLALALLLPVAAHGLYDAPLMTLSDDRAHGYRSALLLWFAALLLAELVIAVLLLRRSRRHPRLHAPLADAAMPY